jgi:hypothetical protein
MNKIAKLIQQIADQGIKQPEICMVRNVNDNYIDVEPINTDNFKENMINNDNLIKNIRLSIDQENDIIGNISYSKPLIGSRVVLFYTEDKIPFILNYNKIGDIIDNLQNIIIGLNDLNLSISGTTNIVSKNINIESNDINIKSTNFNLNSQNGNIKIQNNTGDIKSILLDIQNSLNLINAKAAASIPQSVTGAESIILGLVQKINSLF